LILLFQSIYSQAAAVSFRRHAELLFCQAVGQAEYCFCSKSVGRRLQ